VSSKVDTARRLLSSPQGDEYRVAAIPGGHADGGPMAIARDDFALIKIQQERDLYRQERDLYRRLLELGEETHLEPLLRDALALIVEVVGAHRGYLELHR
jgi:hypothetical protein